MNDNIDFSKRHLVIGLGATGQSIIKTLLHFHTDIIWGIDTRTTFNMPDEIADQCQAIHYGDFSEATGQALLNNCDYLWVSPGIDIRIEELQACISRIGIQSFGGDIELFARLNDTPVTAITGTNGKSTVTSLLAHVAQSAGLNIKVGGNLGEPALNLFLQAQEESHNPDLYILELSSFQLDTTHSLNLLAAAILNITPDHLERYDSFEAYQASKIKIFQQAKVLIANADDLILKLHLSEFQHKTIYTFSTDAGNAKSEKVTWNLDQQSEMIQFYQGKQLHFDASISPIDGLHNYANILATAAMCQALKIPISALIKALPSFQGLQHRCQLIRTHKNIRWYNDSKATNIPSTLAALKGFPEKKWLILGGLGKQQDFSVFRNLRDYNVIGVAIIGLDAPQILASLDQTKLTVINAQTLEVAVQEISKQAKTNEIVLLSPACASMDQFKNFEERGEMFKNLVNQLS